MKDKIKDIKIGDTLLLKNLLDGAFEGVVLEIKPGLIGKTYVCEVSVRDSYKDTESTMIMKFKQRNILDVSSASINYHIPTLEEAIEQCGDDFFSLSRTKSGEYIAAGNLGPGRVNTDKALNGEFEKTPLEAVLNLWLEINKK